MEGGAEIDFNVGQPLRNAVLHRNLSVAILLLDRGANIETRSGEYRRTPLHVAVLNILTPEPEVEHEAEEELAMFELLLDRGDDMEAEFSCSTSFMSLIVPPNSHDYSEASIIAIKMLLD